MARPDPFRAANLSTLALWTGRDRATIRRKLKKRGVRPVQQYGRESLYSPPEALPAILDVGKLNLTAESARRDAARADAVGLANENLRGALIPADECSALVRALAATVAATFEDVAERAARAAHTATTIPEAEQAIRREIDGALAVIADGAEGYSRP